LINNRQSHFIAGLFTGLLVATCGFALLVRHQNLSRGSSGGQLVLKLGHGLDQNHPVHQAMLQMAEILQEKSNGSVRLQVFPNGQLGSETDCIEQLQRGALAMTKTSAAPMESFIPEMALFGVPYAFRDEEQCWSVLEGEIGKQLLAAGQRVGLRGLCYYDAGSRNFYTIDKPVLTPKDLQGLKIRVQKSKTAMDMVEALGGAPTPIPWGELYTALQQKMVDGAENNPPSFYSNRHSEVCKHLTMNEHTRVPDILLCSEKVWQKLSPQVQQWVQESADESSRFQRQLWKEKTVEALAEVEKEGVTVYYPDTTLFAEQVAPMQKAYEGTAVGALLDRIKQE
jgi:tripartite ATP-independent transporter DctP family solute receptor